MKNLKQTLCGVIVLVSLFLTVVLSVHYTEADRYGQAILIATVGYLAVHIAAKVGGLYYRPEQTKQSGVQRDLRSALPTEKTPCTAATMQGNKTKYSTKSITEK